jgi:hypothetical protein
MYYLFWNIFFVWHVEMNVVPISRGSQTQTNCWLHFCDSNGFHLRLFFSNKNLIGFTLIINVDLL